MSAKNHEVSLILGADGRALTLATKKATDDISSIADAVDKSAKVHCRTGSLKIFCY